MHKKTILALGGATLALAVASPVALGAGTQVTVRVEGKTRTLLQTKSVHTHGGFITRRRRAVRQRARRAAAPARSTSRPGIAGQAMVLQLRLPDQDDPRRDRRLHDSKYLLGASSSTTAGDERRLRPSSCSAAISSCSPPSPHGHRVSRSRFSAPRQVAAGKSFKVKVSPFNAKGKAKPARRCACAIGKERATDSHGVARRHAHAHRHGHPHRAPKGSSAPTQVACASAVGRVARAAGTSRSR